MNDLDDLCRRLALRPEEEPKHRRTLTFETFEDGDVLVTCAEHPLLALLGSDAAEAFRLGWCLADELDKRNHD